MSQTPWKLRRGQGTANLPFPLSNYNFKQLALKVDKPSLPRYNSQNCIQCMRTILNLSQVVAHSVEPTEEAIFQEMMPEYH